MAPHWKSNDRGGAQASSRWVRLNQTATDYPQRCLPELFEARAAATPRDIAVIHRDKTIRYRELNESANRLAHHLVDLGVAPEVPVGIAVNSSIDRVVGILAILKAGGAYLPLDPEYPEARLRCIFEETQVSVLITEESLVAQLPAGGAKFIRIDADADRFARFDAANPCNHAGPETLAYIIYTSGSTGRPKGIAIRHSGIVNNLTDLIRSFAIGSEDRVLAISSLTFDMCVFEVLGTLLAGAAIVLPDASRAKDPAHWAELVIAHEVSIWNSAPALLEMFATYLEPKAEVRPSSLRLALLGGDWIPVSLPDRVRALAPSIQVVSLGGATEASIHSTIYPLAEVDPAWASIPYGRPMANQRTYILDEELRLVPEDASGELYIGGSGLARGYFGQPAMTAEKFVPDAYSGEPGARLYRTGDLVRHLPDGNLELLGRVDFQVKIRGHRIELREIESTLLSDPRVAAAVVTGHRDATGGPRLVAYVVLAAPIDDGSGDEIPFADSDAISQWAAVYEQTYGAGDAPSGGRDFSGWVSSFSGLPFSDGELAEIVDRTVEQILALRPRRVLEIGCGTGLVLFDVAPHCARYDGTDISATALDSVRRRIAEVNTGPADIRLARRPAHDFEGVEPQSYDTVVINSVVQHFPSIPYLVRVLDGATRALRPGGAIYVGDLRNLMLLRAFHTAIELQEAPDSMNIGDLVQLVDRRVRQEKELWVDPRFFVEWSRTVEGNPTAEIRVRRARHRNEMSLYHYDVVINFGDGAGSRTYADRIEWRAKDQSFREFHQRLRRSAPESLEIRDVPDARLADLLSLTSCCEDLDTSATVADLRSATGNVPDERAVEPDEFWGLADSEPFTVDVVWPQSDRVGHYDVLLRRAVSAVGSGEELPPADRSTPDRTSSLEAPALSRASAADWNRYGTRHQPREAGDLISELRSALGSTLPDFMVPSDFVVLDELPLNLNGKVDRRALPAPVRSRSRLEVEFNAPVTPLQEVVAQIWSVVLDIERIGIDDNFFELGGHSLTAVQIVARVNETFPLSAPLGMLFTFPSVAAYVEQLESLAHTAGVDLHETAEVVLEVSRLSDDEVSSSLAESNDEMAG